MYSVCVCVCGGGGGGGGGGYVQEVHMYCTQVQMYCSTNLFGWHIGCNLNFLLCFL